ncbi:phosphate/phosphite/phosphonate ABC transporter substrate-binding protein [Magnetospirillum fulvum]|uniref:Phosphonate transport system substrate-binding protein n=1 Tax=Magnetospirillum fulvum TaxID=1082 RepID=A0A1H6H9A6_MAGFU|nr:phosphate/phosphite/phosphonate ABC transporter substrate-binding protein [Magnetospirillum fulvum]SEH32389.1 phosphonate transport system substrate-binding protein [Magnetospirillum fulvum]
MIAATGRTWAGWRRALCALLISLCGLPAAAAEPVGFALLSSRPQAESEAAWQPLLDRLSQRLGSPVVVHWYPDYAGAIWGIRSGRDKLGYFGNKSAIEAVDKAGAEVFAAQTGPSGLGYYHSLLIVARTAPFDSAEAVIAGAAALTLGIGDPNSTSGTVVPFHYLFRTRGLDPRALFRRVVAGHHPDNIAGVAAGRLDAATVSSEILDHVAATRPDLAGRVREVWRSPPIPANPLIWRKDLPDSDKNAIRGFFLQLGSAAPAKSAVDLAAERRALDRLELGGFAATDDNHLVPVRRLDLLESRWRLEHEGGPGASVHRAARLAEIERRLIDLDRHRDIATDTNPLRTE